MIALDFNQPGIAVFASGARVSIYSGEAETEVTFSGELLNPSERELRMNTHVSCFWDRSKVIRIERVPA